MIFLQLQELLDGTDAILDMCSPELKVVLQKLQQEVVESWENLRMHMEQREEELQSAKDRYMFLNTVSYTHSTIFKEDFKLQGLIWWKIRKYCLKTNL